jgi:hypothetical protein
MRYESLTWEGPWVKYLVPNAKYLLEILYWKAVEPLSGGAWWEVYSLGGMTTVLLPEPLHSLSLLLHGCHECAACSAMQSPPSCAASAQADWSWTETSESMSQSKTFTFLSWLSQFCGSCRNHKQNHLFPWKGRKDKNYHLLYEWISVAILFVYEKGITLKGRIWVNNEYRKVYFTADMRVCC